eukprot:scaffold12464_cov123-Isochrysis_galbana.AAC.1
MGRSPAEAVVRHAPGVPAAPRSNHTTRLPCGSWVVMRGGGGQDVHVAGIKLLARRTACERAPGRSVRCLGSERSY